MKESAPHGPREGKVESFKVRSDRLKEILALSKSYNEVNQEVTAQRVADRAVDPGAAENLQQMTDRLAREVTFIRDSLTDPVLIKDALLVCDELMMSPLLELRISEKIADSAVQISSHLEKYPDDLTSVLRLMIEAHDALKGSQGNERSAVKIRHALNVVGPSLQLYFSEANPALNINLKYRLFLLGALLRLADEKNSQWMCQEMSRHIALAVGNNYYDATYSSIKVLEAAARGELTPVSISLTREDLTTLLRDVPSNGHVIKILDGIMAYFKLPRDMHLELDEDALESNRSLNAALVRMIDQLDQIQYLETIERGSVAEMHERFGIRWFSRYPKEVLKRQYNERESQKPYGVFICAAADWSHGTFEDNDVNTIRDLSRQLGTDHLLRIIECGSLNEVEQRFEALNTAYGKGKSVFLFIRAHSNRTGLTLGKGEMEGSLFKEDLASPSAGPLRDNLSPDAPIIFDGCSVGRRGGIAQTASEVFNTTVIAPKGNESTLTRVRLTSVAPINFEIEYDDKPDASAHIYKNGRKVG